MNKQKLRLPAILILFTTSYIPLFFLLILRQFKQNIAYLNFSGFHTTGIICFFEKFGLSLFLILITITSILGLYILIQNFDKNHHNGHLVRVIEIENKNSESIAYISTYIVPFIFQDANNWFDILSIFLILLLIFRIYLKSNMVVVNPILNLKRNIHQIVYFTKSGRTKKGIIISTMIEIEEKQDIKINQISKDIYYGH